MLEQLELIPRKIIRDSGSITYTIKHIGNSNRNAHIASMLDMYDIGLCEDIIEDIEHAQNHPSQTYVNTHGPDSLDTSSDIEIISPNVLLCEGLWSIPMQDWKQLMIEWRDFQINNS